MDRKKLLTRLYELMLLLAIGFACVPFIRGCVSGLSSDTGQPSMRVDDVSIGGTLRVPHQDGKGVVFVQRNSASGFRIFSLDYDAQANQFITADEAIRCDQVLTGYNHVSCERAEGGFTWDENGTPSAPGMPSLGYMRYRVDKGRLYYGAAAD